MFKSARDSSGFTILEVLVSAAIAGTFLTGLVVMVSNINIANDRTRDLVVANSFIENKVEELRSETFVALSDETIDFTTEMPKTLTKPRSSTYTISSEDINLKRIVFDMSYDDHGKIRVLTYTTFVGELGVGQY